MKERCPACWKVSKRALKEMDQCCPSRLRRVALLLQLRDACYEMPGQRLAAAPSAGEAPADETEGQRRARERRHGEAMLAKLEAERRVREGTSDEMAWPEYDAWQRHHEAGSWLELDRAMERLSSHRPSQAWLLNRAYIMGLVVGVGRDERLRALGALSGLLPEELRVPNNPSSPAEQEEQRRVDVLRWHGEGRSSRWIADKVGRSHTYVQGVVRRSEESAA